MQYRLFVDTSGVPIGEDKAESATFGVEYIPPSYGRPSYVWFFDEDGDNGYVLSKYDALELAQVLTRAANMVES